MKALYTLALLGIVVVMIACGGQKNERLDQLNSAQEHSELGILMHNMFDDAEQMKEAIERGEKPVPQVDYKEMLTATPSEEEKTSNPHYGAFSQQYFQAMARLETANSEEAPDAFNSMVGTCVDCHEVACPGVIRKIKRLY